MLLKVITGDGETVNSERLNPEHKEKYIFLKHRGSQVSWKPQEGSVLVSHLRLSIEVKSACVYEGEVPAGGCNDGEKGAKFVLGGDAGKMG